jgi:hypothetical protein
MDAEFLRNLAKTLAAGRKKSTKTSAAPLPQLRSSSAHISNRKLTAF